MNVHLVKEAIPSVLIAATFFGASVAIAGEKERDIVTTAASNDQFSTLVAAVSAGDLATTLSGEGPFTVFAPTNEAFAKLPPGTVEALLKPENRGQLVEVLKYHVVPGRMDASRVVKAPGAVTAGGQMIKFSASKKDGVRVDNASIVSTDIVCSNGVIHVIDQVLIPASDNIVITADKAKSFKTLLTAATTAGLAQTLAKDGPYTLFAPSDAAFAKLPEGTVEALLLPENREQLTLILKNHLVKGRVYSPMAVSAGGATTLAGTRLPIKVAKGKAMVGGAGIVATDIDASNGVIHVIDTVLIPSG
jgi:uncharacterized surface protein with fasciclin (FAS1) repeats